MKKFFVILLIFLVFSSAIISCYPRNIIQTSLLYEADLTRKDPLQTDAQVMASIQSTIEKRIHVYGISNPEIQVQGNNRILVGLPKVKDIGEVMTLIGQEGLLEFKEQKLDVNGNVLYDSSGNLVWQPAMAIGSDGITQEALTSAYLKTNAYVTTDSLGKPEVACEWNPEGSKLFGEITTQLYDNGINSKPLGIFLDGTLIIDPTVRAVITNKFVIMGVTLSEAKDLAIELNSGTLDVPLALISNTTN